MLRELRQVAVALLLMIGMQRAIARADEQARPPQGAIVLFDGKDTSQWSHRDGRPCEWSIVDDAMQVNVDKGDVITRQKFQDCTLHVEFWLPKLPPEFQGQDRGNSGVFLMDQYEVQVLDSYGLKSGTGDCGAIYGRKAPDVNACKAPEQWQTYDIIFMASRWDKDGKKLSNARITVFHNGIKIHDNAEIAGRTDKGAEHPGPASIRLQDHHHQVRYRNIWVVPANP